MHIIGGTKSHSDYLKRWGGGYSMEYSNKIIDNLCKSSITLVCYYMKNLYSNVIAWHHLNN